MRLVELTIGIFIVAISILGYVSNWLNWKFLNYKINHLLYYFGAFIHESSHALLCILTGAKIKEYKVFVKEPHVTYVDSKLPLLGNLLIAIAPILGGLSVVYFLNEFFFTNFYSMPHFSDLRNFMSDFIYFLKQIDLSSWENIVSIFLFFNMGSMLGPSSQDLKNVWFLILILVFVPSSLFSELGFLAISLILINIILQILVIIIISIFKFFKK